MNTTSNLIVADCGVENSVTSRSYGQMLNDFREREKERKQLENQPEFRKKEIKLITIDNDNGTENAFDATISVKENTRNKHLISYEGKLHEREQFLYAMFPEYKKYQYKARFFNDNVFYLSGSQRAKLQYHILAQNFELVTVDEQDKIDLQLFCNKHKIETMQKWLNRMLWNNGHEYMITFGASLDVRSYRHNGKTIGSNIKSVWCYRVQMDNDKAIYKGVQMTWEEWAKGVISFVQFRLAELKRTYGDKAQLQTDDSQCIGRLYYQKGLYLTLPQTEGNALKLWLNRYIKNGYAAFPYSGNIPLADFEFTVDFKKDTEIVRAYDLKSPAQMVEYNRAHNAEHNKELGRLDVLKTLARLNGDEWRRKDIIAQGLYDKDINNFLKHGLIIKTGWGQYKRAFPQS